MAFNVQEFNAVARFHGFPSLEEWPDIVAVKKKGLDMREIIFSGGGLGWLERRDIVGGEFIVHVGILGEEEDDNIVYDTPLALFDTWSID